MLSLGLAYDFRSTSDQSEHPRGLEWLFSRVLKMHADVEVLKLLS